MSKILLANWNVDFFMNDEHEISRVKEATNELANLISSLNFGSEEILIEEYVQWVGEYIVDAKYNMAKLVDLAWVESRAQHFPSNLYPYPDHDH